MNVKLIFKATFVLVFIYSITAYSQTGTNMMDSAKYYRQNQDINTAVEWGRKAIIQTKNEFGNHDTNYAKSISLLAELYYFTGNLDSAIYYQEINQNLCRNLFKTDHQDLAESLNNMAVYLDGRGRYTEDEALYNESLSMYRRLYKGDNPDLALTLNNVAYFLDLQGRNSEAEQLFKESLEMRRRLFKEDHQDLASSINFMAYFYDNMGRYDEAEPLYREALAMTRRLYKTDHNTLSFNINNMAIFLNARGRYVEAEPLFKESLDMSRRLNKGVNPDLAHNIMSMAFYLSGRKRYDESETLFKEALAMYRRIFRGDHHLLAKSINKVAYFYEGISRYADAEPLYKEGIQIYTNILTNYFPSLSEKEKKLFWNSVSSSFERFNSFAVIRSTENPRILCDFFDTRLYTKALLLNSFNKVKSRIMNSGDSSLNARYRSWSDMKKQLVNLYQMSNEELQKNNINIDSIEKVANDLEKQNSLMSEQFAQSYEKKKVNWKTIQTILKPDEAAVEVVRFKYYQNDRWTDSVYYAFLIITDQTEDHPDLILFKDGKQLENEYYNDHISSLKSKIDDTLSFIRYWGKLNDKLKNYKKIYFSADGIYNKLNPSTFLMPDGKYLFDLQDIQQVNSTKDLLLNYYQSKQESNIFNSAILIGNPNFSLPEDAVKEASKKIKNKMESEKSYEQLSSSRGIYLTKLPGTEKEIKDIEKFLKSKNWIVSTYLWDMAVKSAVKSANSPRVLHIATHGLFLEDVKRDGKELFGFEEQKMVENPLLRSGLFFTGANTFLHKEKTSYTEEENGLLTAYEAMNLDLDKTELVVLSACETGLGDIQNGEGVFGLRRAFQQAGAKTVLMSLWKVNDEATQELMSSFYKNWISGMTKREAFKKAQLEIRSKFPSPYYWGAFVMVGE